MEFFAQHQPPDEHDLLLDDRDDQHIALLPGLRYALDYPVDRDVFDLDIVPLKNLLERPLPLLHPDIDTDTDTATLDLPFAQRQSFPVQRDHRFMIVGRDARAGYRKMTPRTASTITAATIQSHNGIAPARPADGECAAGERPSVTGSVVVPGVSYTPVRFGWSAIFILGRSKGKAALQHGGGDPGSPALEV